MLPQSRARFSKFLSSIGICERAAWPDAELGGKEPPPKGRKPVHPAVVAAGEVNAPDLAKYAQFPPRRGSDFVSQVPCLRVCPRP